MKNVLVLCKNILKITFKKKGNWVTFLLLPLLGVFAALAFNNQGTSQTKVGVYSQNKTYLANDMVNYISNNGNFKIYKTENSNYKEMIKNKQVDCILVIPKDFDKQIMEGKLTPIKVLSEQGEEVTAWIENYLTFYIDNLVKISQVSKGDSNKFKSIYDGYKNEELKLNDLSVKDKTKSKGATKQSIGFLLVFMLMASKVTTDFILNDKYSRTFFRIFCASVTKTQYIAANVISNMVVFLLQVFIILFVSINILKLNFYIDLINLIIVFGTFGLAAISFGVLIAAFSKTTAQASQLQNILIVPTSMLSGCFWSIDLMPNIFQKISLVFPQTWLLKAVDELQYGKTLTDVKLELAMIILFALILFLIGINKFRRDDDIRNVI